MTKSKTKLIKVERKFSVDRAVVEKAALEAYAELGIVLPGKQQSAKKLKAKS